MDILIFFFGGVVFALAGLIAEDWCTSKAYSSICVEEKKSDACGSDGGLNVSKGRYLLVGDMPVGAFLEHCIYTIHIGWSIAACIRDKGCVINRCAVMKLHICRKKGNIRCMAISYHGRTACWWNGIRMLLGWKHEWSTSMIRHVKRWCWINRWWWRYGWWEGWCLFIHTALLHQWKRMLLIREIWIRFVNGCTMLASFLCLAS